MIRTDIVEERAEGSALAMVEAAEIRIVTQQHIDIVRKSRFHSVFVSYREKSLFCSGEF